MPIQLPMSREEELGQFIAHIIATYCGGGVVFTYQDMLDMGAGRYELEIFKHEDPFQIRLTVKDTKA